MIIRLKEDSILMVQLLSYDNLSELKERFSFLEMSTLQATTLLPMDRKINSITVFSYTNDSKYLDDQTIKDFKTVGNFNDFFLENEQYYIADCDLELENGLFVSSHDDGEVSIELTDEKSNQQFIEAIFEKFKLKKSLISVLKSKPGYYFSIDIDSNIIAEYETFDEYVENGMK